jgi:hypothetical protein
VEYGEPEGSAGRQRNLAVARGGAEQWDEACSAADLAADLIRPRPTLGVVASEVALVRNEALAVYARLPATLPANLRRECLDAFAVLEESLEAAGDRGSALELRRRRMRRTPSDQVNLSDSEDEGEKPYDLS